MELETEVVADAVGRLRRVEGQVAGIIRMIETQRECRDVVTQISAASKALDQVGFRLVASGLRHCLDGEDGAPVDGYSVADFEKLFLRLA
jgi:DNA-binding FrmR family transcriptional regulator